METTPLTVFHSRLNVFFYISTSWSIIRTLVNPDRKRFRYSNVDIAYICTLWTECWWGVYWSISEDCYDPLSFSKEEQDRLPMSSNRYLSMVIHIISSGRWWHCTSYSIMKYQFPIWTTVSLTKHLPTNKTWYTTKGKCVEKRDMKRLWCTEIFRWLERPAYKHELLAFVG